MTGQDAQETKTTALLRYEELQVRLDHTKAKLNEAAVQLEELTKILLSHHAGSLEGLSRPWLEELAVAQVIDDLSQAEQKLAAVRTLAAELGIPLPPHLR